jgi:tRNA pseudouridine38-40 synthase
LPRYFISLAYDGTAYHGWQIQPNARSVQEEIESALSKLHGNRSIEVVGCGRTDAGVHAQHYFLHTNLPQQWDTQQLVFKLNRMTAPDVAFKQAWEVSSDLHARFDASKRTYRYFIHQHKNPFVRNASWYLESALDVEQMNVAAQHLLGTQDFSSFAKAHTDVKTNICEVFSAQWLFAQHGAGYCRNACRGGFGQNKSLRTAWHYCCSRPLGGVCIGARTGLVFMGYCL